MSSTANEEIDAVVNNNEPKDDSLPEETLDNEEKSQDSSQEFSDIEVEEEEPAVQLDSKIELLYDLQLPVSIELGRTNMLIRNILRLGRGSVIEFDKLVSEPVDILINGKKVAEGEVVVIDKHFGIRITTLIDPSERIRSIEKS